MKKHDSFGSRMKEYEFTTRNFLPKRMPVMIRLDGKAFHKFTKGMVKPFDKKLASAMWETTKFLCKKIQGCKMGYTQSDEITLLLTNYEEINTESWYNNNLQKMISVSASLATAKFNEEIKKHYPEKELAFFDSRVWVLPMHEVANGFLWRQQDATKNSISMVAQANFSQDSLQNLNGNQLQDKLWKEKEINWNFLPVWQKRGVAVIKKQITKESTSPDGKPQKVVRNVWNVDFDTPIFSKDRQYIEKFVYPMDYFTSMLNKAIALAAKLHQGQTDKGGENYILHPLRLMMKFKDEKQRIVAVLHDILEDTPYTAKQLLNDGFDEEIVAAVVALTRREDETYEEFILRIKENELATSVKIEDIRDNLDLTRLPEEEREKHKSLTQRYQKALETLLN